MRELGFDFDENADPLDAPAAEEGKGDNVELGESAGTEDGDNMEAELADFGVMGFGDDDQPDVDPYSDSVTPLNE